MTQKCAMWGCDENATYEKPLCYEHWRCWEAWEIEECSRCHYYYEDPDFFSFYEYDDKYPDEYQPMCDDCLAITLIDDGKVGRGRVREPERKPIKAHGAIERSLRYVYILKLSDGTFYIGQTNDLHIRMQEHKDGQQAQTKGKNPKLVFYEEFAGMRKEVDKREMELTILNADGAGQRKLRQIIEGFRAPLRLLDLEA